MSGLLARRARRRGAWDPGDLPNLWAWFDADDASTFSYSSGSVVSEWRDKSGNTQHVSQGTPANQPIRDSSINSVTAVRYNRTDGPILFRTVSGFSLDYTLVYVAESNLLGSSEQVVVSFRSSTTDTPILAQSGYVAAHRGVDHRNDSGNLNRVGASTWGTSTARLITVRKTGTSLKIWNSGGTAFASATTTAGATTVNAFAIGGTRDLGASGNFWDGEIGELIICDNAESQADIDLAGDYLADKWGLTWTGITL